MMPRRALVVLAAICSPPGTSKVTRIGRSVTSPTAARIIRLGTGLMAGAPTGRPSPGLVTVPTPMPASSSVSGAADHSAVTVMRAPSVQSGSSPASFTTTQRFDASASTGKATRSPLGRRTFTSRGGVPVVNPMAAAFAAADAHVPVVHPVRKPLLTRSDSPSETCASSSGSTDGCAAPVVRWPGRRRRVRARWCAPWLP